MEEKDKITPLFIGALLITIHLFSLLWMIYEKTIFINIVIIISLIVIIKFIKLIKNFDAFLLYIIACILVLNGSFYLYKYYSIKWPCISLLMIGTFLSGYIKSENIYYRSYCAIAKTFFIAAIIIFIMIAINQFVLK